MNVNVYVISHSDGACSNPSYLSGPLMEEKEFQNLCDSLLEEAAIKACRPYTYDDGTQISMSIGWPEVIDALIEILCEKHNFQKIILKTQNYLGGYIIQPPYAASTSEEDKKLGKGLENIIEWNKKAEEEQS